MSNGELLILHLVICSLICVLHEILLKKTTTPSEWWGLTAISLVLIMVSNVFVTLAMLS